MIFGRNAAEQALSIDGSTIYKVIQRMQDDKTISIESNNQYSIITLLNFDDYQLNEDDEIIIFDDIVTTKEQPKNNQRTTKEQQSNNSVTQIENVNKEEERIKKEEKEKAAALAKVEIAKKTVLEKKEKLKNQLSEYVEKFGRDICNGFYRYWGEADDKGKLRFEKQKTWELKLRLITWAEKQDSFKK